MIDSQTADVIYDLRDLGYIGSRKIKLPLFEVSYHGEVMPIHSSIIAAVIDEFWEGL
ncbi:MAG: hypothetical protein JRN00_07930 [Nitrososphaerota archaeon]|jgi:hypothetical protein|nr:hypothetical protein [Nitrososphaerota archaeon]